MNSILICDDEKDIVRALKIYLTNPEYQLYEAYNGKEAVELCQKEKIDLVLMDIMMPDMNGIQALSEIRKTSNVPVILLTAKSEDSDKILGLNIGADDYITKPFNPLEVAARVNSQLRRYHNFNQNSQDGLYRIGGILLNDSSKNVLVDEEPVRLTPKEFDILKLLMESPGKVFSCAEIYSRVWKEDPLIGNENIVAVHIRHLREKIEINPNEPQYIRVIFGQGYKITGDRQR